MLPLKYRKYNLIETKDGISDTVYLLDDKFVLKVFENTTSEQIENEKNLLNKLTNINTCKILDTFKVNGKFAVIYSYISGQSINNANISHIKQIAIFLKDLHTQTQSLENTNIKLFKKDKLKTLILSTNNSQLIQYFDEINIELKNDGLIHGDIFLDNVKFIDEKLSGVYDFSEACEGDFLFDLAVVAISWCYDENELNYDKLSELLKSYNTNIEISIFIEYMKYALLYYATTRYIINKDYKSLLKKIKRV
jgi:homoserine kinase type II